MTSERIRSTLARAASESSRWFTKPVSASTLASGLPGPDLGVDVLELLGGDLAALDEDRAELVARVVRRAEQDRGRRGSRGPSGTTVLPPSGSRWPLAVEVDEEEGEGLGIDAAR